MECKFHEPQTGNKVSVPEVDDFAARVLRLRGSGDVSSGYLVTNTDFTAPAKGAFAGRPEGKFVFLRTLAGPRIRLASCRAMRRRERWRAHPITSVLSSAQSATLDFDAKSWSNFAGRISTGKLGNCTL